MNVVIMSDSSKVKIRSADKEVLTEVQLYVYFIFVLGEPGKKI